MSIPRAENDDESVLAAFRESAKGLCKKLRQSAIKIGNAAAATGDDAWNEIVQSGWLSVRVPEERGGLGFAND